MSVTEPFFLIERPLVLAADEEAPPTTWRQAVQCAAGAFNVNSIAGPDKEGLLLFHYHFWRNTQRLNDEPALRAAVETLHRLIRASSLPFNIELERSIRAVNVRDGVLFDDTFIHQELERMRREVSQSASSAAEGSRTSSTLIADALSHTGMYLPDMSVQAQVGERKVVLGTIEIKALRDMDSLEVAMERWDVVWRLRSARSFCLGVPFDMPGPKTFLDGREALKLLREVARMPVVRQIQAMTLPRSLRLTRAVEEPVMDMPVCSWENLAPSQGDVNDARQSMMGEDARLKARVGIAQELGYALIVNETCGAAHGAVIVGPRMCRMLVLDHCQVILELKDMEEGLYDIGDVLDSPLLYNDIPHVLVGESGGEGNAIQRYLNLLGAMALRFGDTPIGECPPKLPSLRRDHSPLVLSPTAKVSAQSAEEVRRIMAAARPSLSSGDAPASSRRKRSRGDEVESAHKRPRDKDQDRGPGTGGSSHATRSASTTTPAATGATADSHEPGSSAPAGSRSAAPSGPIRLPPEDLADAHCAEDGLGLGEDAFSYNAQNAAYIVDEGVDLEGDIGDNKWSSELQLTLELLAIFRRAGIKIEVVRPSRMDQLMRWTSLRLEAPQASADESRAEIPLVTVPVDEAIDAAPQTRAVSRAPTMARTGTTQSATSGPLSPADDDLQAAPQTTNNQRDEESTSGMSKATTGIVNEVP